MPKIEITKEDLFTDYSDWAEVFGEGTGGNTTDETDAIPDNSDIDTSPPKRADVVEIIAAVNGENDADEWIGVFKLKDGRYLVACGSCDYTGWDCQASNCLQVAKSLEDILEYGLTPQQKERLEL